MLCMVGRHGLLMFLLVVLFQFMEAMTAEDGRPF